MTMNDRSKDFLNDFKKHKNQCNVGQPFGVPNVKKHPVEILNRNSDSTLVRILLRVPFDFALPLKVLAESVPPLPIRRYPPYFA